MLLGITLYWTQTKKKFQLTLQQLTQTATVFGFCKKKITIIYAKNNVVSKLNPQGTTQHNLYALQSLRY